MLSGSQVSAGPLRGVAAILSAEGTGEDLAIGEAALIGDGIERPKRLLGEQALGVLHALTAEPLAEHSPVGGSEPLAYLLHSEATRLANHLYREILLQVASGLDPLFQPTITHDEHGGVGCSAYVDGGQEQRITGTVLAEQTGPKGEHHGADPYHGCRPLFPPLQMASTHQLEQ